MDAVDRESALSTEVLIARAGAAVARSAIEMLGGTYRRRVVVVAGKGNNGADGRVAAARLASRGVRIEVVDAEVQAPKPLPPCDLVIDAAYGTGYRGQYRAPATGAALVLAVDLPSGVDADTGEAAATAVVADRTVTFAALKPGLMLGAGLARAGVVEVADIGLDVSRARAWVVEADDVAAWWPRRDRESHKWASAVWVVAGSPGMTGAASLCAAAAMRTGAGMVRVGVPGAHPPDLPIEAVGATLPAAGWDTDVLGDLARFGALVMGPGLSVTSDNVGSGRRLAAQAEPAMVIDAGGLDILGNAEETAAVIRDRGRPTVLTPHDGEFRRLAKRLEVAEAGPDSLLLAAGPPPVDRISTTRDLARRTGAVVLRKGPTTVVADPKGIAYLTVAIDSRLATAGTGDVLAGVIAALLSGGLSGIRAAAGGAFVHARAAELGWSDGLVASDVVGHLPAAVNALLARRR